MTQGYTWAVIVPERAGGSGMQNLTELKPAPSVVVRCLNNDTLHDNGYGVIVSK